MPKEIQDAHFKVETAKKFVVQGLEKYVQSKKIPDIIKRYDDKIIIETGGQLQLAFNDLTEKSPDIPFIKPKKIGDFTIEDAKPEDYPFISPLMGMIVNCCAYPCGSGSTLCQATRTSPWFKTMLIKKGGKFKG